MDSNLFNRGPIVMTRAPGDWRISLDEVEVGRTASGGVGVRSYNTKNQKNLSLS